MRLPRTLRDAARIDAWQRIADVDPHGLIASHPLRRHPDAGGYYSFPVPVLPGDFVTEDTGTGFVHIAPGHGQDDFELGTRYGIDVPFTVDADGSYFADVGIFAGKRVMNDKGAEGDANGAVIAALQEVGALIARGRLRHDYPHSWRSKKPVIFRNTPQWFIAMDEDIDGGDTLARARPESHRRDAMGAAARREPHPRHGPDQARLGGLAPARLGRADHRVSPQGKRTRDPRPRLQRVGRIDRPHHRSLPQGGRRCLVRGGRQGALPPRPRRRPGRVGEGRGHSRCLVRFRLDPRLRSRDAPRSRLACLALSRRLRPASRLVPILAARGLRHARASAVRGCAHPWLRRRRGRAQDVEVHGQCRGAAGRDPPVGRRDPAALGHELRLCRGSPHRPGHHQGQCRILPQAQEHAPLHARQSRPLPAEPRRRLQRDA